MRFNPGMAQLKVSVPGELLARLDEAVERMRRDIPGCNTSRSEVVRVSLHRYLATAPVPAGDNTTEDYA